MAFQIRVSPEALRHSAQEIRAQIDRGTALSDRIQSVGQRVNDAWDGPASQEVVENLQELFQYSNQAKERLQGSAELAQATAEIFEQIDSGEADSAGIAIRRDLIGSLKPIPGAVLKLFSGGAIRVVPDQLREAASECRSVANGLEELLDRITGIDSELQNFWEGRSYGRFSEELSESKDMYRSLTRALEEISEKIVFAADRYEEIDNMLNQ